MQKTNQIILGAGGNIGKPLVEELYAYNAKVFLYGRNPRRVTASDILIQGSLLDKDQTMEALKGMHIAYLVAGIPYSTAVWKEQWPVIMTNVIEACKTHKVKLVFLDNIYMYDPAALHCLNENTPLKAVSQKGMIREAIAAMLLKEMNAGTLDALIARSADFYGSDSGQTMFDETVLKPVLNNKKAKWFIDLDRKHSITWVKDAASGLALLGNTPEAYNQIWHLPTDKAYTGRELVQLAGAVSGKPARVMLVKRMMATLLGIFISPVRESAELLYQFEQDYVFDSTRFEKAFALKATPIQEVFRKYYSSTMNNTKTF